MPENVLTEFEINMPKAVEKIISTIEKNGLQAYAVGGCIRDTLLGRTPEDWDITTSALPGQIKALFKKTIDTGIAHGTVTVMMDNTGYEVTTYRIDGEYEDGRHPKSVSFSVLLKDDLCRRDFTINAMAYNHTNGFIDEFGGVQDLNNRIIRCVGDAKKRFTEDALRMMRAIRFSAQLGFEIEQNTYQAIVSLAPTISKISMERIHVELGKTLTSDNPDYIMLFSDTGLFAPILPVIDEILHGRYCKKTLTMLRLIRNHIILRYTALFSSTTPENATKTLRALKMDNKTIDTVSRLVSISKLDIDESEPAVRNALNKYGKEILNYYLEFAEANAKASSEITGIYNPAKLSHIYALKRLSRDIIDRGDCFCIKDLDITGNDLMEYGLKGPEIGKTLNSLLEIVIENPKLNDKATLIAMIEHL